MRKQTRVLAAAALFTLGASFSAFAAKKGTWTMEDGEWYCIDSNGDVIENEFCLSNGKEYYVGDNGTLVCGEWVEDDGDYYYANSAGQKVKNEWRYLPPFDDEDEEYHWYYFKSNGKRAEDEKLVINGKTYFFDADGIMLTGWVEQSDNSYDQASSLNVGSIYYCGEDGARLSKEWIYDYAPDVDQDDVSSEDEENWYWIKSNGHPATGKQSSINGQTYFFDTEAVMLTGWIATVTDEDSNVTYDVIWDNDEDSDGYYEGGSLSDIVNDGETVYFASEDGHMKKNGWIKKYNNVQFGADDADNKQYWFYISSNGKVYVPNMDDTTDKSNTFVGQRMCFEDADASAWAKAFDTDHYKNHVITDENDDSIRGFYGTWKKINSKTYLFDHDGQMLSQFVQVISEVDDGAEVIEDSVYYFGGWDDGTRKDGSQTIADDSDVSHKFYFATDDKETDGYFNAVGVSGAKNGKLYENGMLVKAKDSKYERKFVAVTYLDGEDYVTVEDEDCYFIVNKSGTIQSSAKDYKEDDDVVASSAGKELFNTDVAALKNAWSDEDAE